MMSQGTKKKIARLGGQFLIAVLLLTGTAIVLPITQARERPLLSIAIHAIPRECKAESHAHCSFQCGPGCNYFNPRES